MVSWCFWVWLPSLSPGKDEKRNHKNTVPEALSKNSSAAPIALRLRGVDLHPSMPSGLGGTLKHPNEGPGPGDSKQKQANRETY